MNLRLLAVLLAVCLIQAEGSREKLKNKLFKLSAQRSSPKKNGIHLLTAPFTASSPLFCSDDNIKAAFNKAFMPNPSGAITVTPVPFTTASEALNNIIDSAWILVKGVADEAKGQVLYAFVEYNACTDVAQLDMSTVKNADLDALFVAAITASGITPATKDGIKAQFIPLFNGIKDQLNTLLITAKTQKTALLMALTQSAKPKLKKIVTDIMDDVYDQYHTFLITSISTFKSKTATVKQILLSTATAFETIVRTAMGAASINAAHGDLTNAINSVFQRLRKEINYIQRWINKAATLVISQLQRNVEKTIIDQVYIDIAAAVATAACT